MRFDFRSAWIGGAVAAILCSVAFVGFRASAQGTVIPPGYAAVVAVCGTLPAAYTAGTLAPVTVDVNGKFCVNQ